MEHGRKRGEAVLVKADREYWGRGEYMGFPVIFRAINNGLLDGQPSIVVTIYDAPRPEGPLPDYLRVPFIDDAPAEEPFRLTAPERKPRKFSDDLVPF